MKRFIFWVLSSLLLAGIIAAVSIERVSAGPAAPNIETLEQPDGASFFARKWGDEWANGYETLEGYAISKRLRVGGYLPASLLKDSWSRR